MQSPQEKTKEINEKFETFFNIYQTLCKIINELPIHPALLDKIRYEFDTAYLWTKEGIQSVIIQIQNEINSDATKENIQH